MEIDPFAGHSQPENAIVSNTTNIEKTSRWLSEDKLKAFSELPLASDSKKPCIRIFINLGSPNPIVLKHYGLVDDGDSLLEIKQITKKDDQWVLFRHETKKIEANFQEICLFLFNLAGPYYLPVEDWANHGGIGGSAWIYEFPVIDGHYVLLRANPLGLKPSRELMELTPQVIDRFSREAHLASYVMLLCSSIAWNFDFSHEE